MSTSTSTNSHSSKKTKKRCPKGTRWNKTANACVQFKGKMKPLLEPTVYFLISCHGQIECAYPGHYEVAKVPESIENIQKITYAPFGCIRSSITTEEKKWIKTLKKEMPHFHKSGFGLELEDKVKTLYNEIHTSPTTYSPSIIPHLPLHLDAIHHKTNRYTSFMVKKSAQKEDIINKYYMHRPGSNENIYVVFQKGGPFKNTDKVFGSEHLKRYVEEAKNGSLAKVLLSQGKFTTELLLDFSSFYGYKSVFIFDGSCDVCVNYDGRKYNMDEVKTIGDKVKEGSLFRGGSNES